MRPTETHPKHSRPLHVANAFEYMGHVAMCLHSPAIPLIEQPEQLELDPQLRGLQGMEIQLRGPEANTLAKRPPSRLLRAGHFNAAAILRSRTGSCLLTGVTGRETSAEKYVGNDIENEMGKLLYLDFFPSLANPVHPALLILARSKTVEGESLAMFRSGNGRCQLTRNVTRTCGRCV